MVNKNEKIAGAKTKATKSAPKVRAVSKPKTEVRTEAVLAVPTPAKAKIRKTQVSVSVRQDDIAVRAYLIAEKRQQLGLPGDSLGDWVEAERQLLVERKANGAN